MKRARNLDGWRNQIDIIDAELLRLISERMKISKAIGTYKLEHNLPIYDKTRWQAMLSTRTAQGKDLGIPSTLVIAFFETIHDHSLAVQKNIEASL